MIAAIANIFLKNNRHIAIPTPIAIHTNMVMLNMIIVYAVVAVGLFVLMCRIVGTVIEYIEGHSRRFRKLLKG